MPVAIAASLDTSPAGVPRVKLDVTGGTGPEVFVYRIDPDGRTVGVRQGQPAVLSAGAVTIYDYEAGFDEAATYSVVDGADTDTSSPITPTSGGIPWLVHPGRPEISVPIAVMDWPTWTRPIVQAVFEPIGRPLRVAVTTRRMSVEGDLVVYTDSPNDGQALEDVLADGTTLLLKGTSVESAGRRWVSIGNVTEQPFELDLREFNVWTLPLIQVEEPSGIALAAVKYSDSTAFFFDYAQATAVAPTYADRSGGEWMT